MKKNILKVALVAAVVATASYGMYENQSKLNLSDVMLENVEALATDEYDPCPNGCLDGGDGCFCHFWFPTYKEKEWNE